MTIREILATRPPADAWATEHLHISDECKSLAAAILQGTATAISDGSYHPDSRIGTSGFILRGLNRHLSAAGANVIPGSPEEQSSYRSELGGISGVLAVVSATCDKYDLQEGCITFGLDGEQALKKAKSGWPLSPTDTDFDLLTDIRAKLKALPIDTEWEWVEGHQDDELSFKHPVSYTHLTLPTICSV